VLAAAYGGVTNRTFQKCNPRDKKPIGWQFSQNQYVDSPISSAPVLVEVLNKFILDSGGEMGSGLTPFLGFLCCVYLLEGKTGITALMKVQRTPHNARGVRLPPKGIESY